MVDYSYSTVIGLRESIRISSARVHDQDFGFDALMDQRIDPLECFGVGVLHQDDAGQIPDKSPFCIRQFFLLDPIVQKQKTSVYG